MGSWSRPPGPGTLRFIPNALLLMCEHTRSSRLVSPATVLFVLESIRTIWWEDASSGYLTSMSQMLGTYNLRPTAAKSQHRKRPQRCRWRRTRMIYLYAVSFLHSGKTDCEPSTNLPSRRNLPPLSRSVLRNLLSEVCRNCVGIAQ